jgi:hypothetical protein
MRFTPELTTTSLPDPTHLPESDGTFVKNFQQHPQSILLTDSIRPVLQQLYPNGQYCIGQDLGLVGSVIWEEGAIASNPVSYLSINRYKIK